MPNATEPTPAEQLADLLEGRLAPDEVPSELAELAELATAVRTHVTPVPPTDAFREALREQVVQAATAPSAAPPAGGTTAATTTATATGASGGLAGVVAGVAAAAVLATSTVAAADRAGPGDLLAGLDRGIESLQLLVADDARDAELLVDFASERVLEALDLRDVAVVQGLLTDADELVGDAVALALEQGRSIEDLLAPYVGSLRTLSSRTDLPEVESAVTQRLEDLGVDPSTPPPAGDESGSADQQDPSDDDGSTGSDAGAPSDGDGTQDGGDSTDPLDEATENVTDPLDDVTEDVTDPLDDVTEDVTDPLDDVTDDVTDPLDDATDPLGP